MAFFFRKFNLGTKSRRGNSLVLPHVSYGPGNGYAVTFPLRCIVSKVVKKCQPASISSGFPYKSLINTPGWSPAGEALRHE